MNNKDNIEANLGLLLRPSVMGVLKDLGDAEFRETIMTLYKFSVTGDEPKINSPIVKIIFDMERSFLDYNRKKFISRFMANNKNNLFQELLLDD